MKKYKEAIKLKDIDFKLLVGVKKETAKEMIEVLETEYFKKHLKGGRKPKLLIEDQLMMTLEYLREYRSMFHIGFDYGLSKSTVHDIIVWIEDILLKSGKFKLPGKKKLLEEDNDIEIILVDVTESPIQRPKKNKENTIQEKRKNTQ